MEDQAESSWSVRLVLVGNDEEVIRVPLSVLDRSPVLQEWARRPDSAPASVKKGKNILLKDFEPETVLPVLHFLGEQGKDTLDHVSTWGDCPLSGQEGSVFLLKMYKFATFIKGNRARDEAVERLNRRNVGLDEFIDAVTAAGDLDLAGETRISGWIGTWLSGNLEKLNDSEEAQERLASGNPQAWVFIRAIMGSMAKMQTKLEDSKTRLAASEERLSTYTDRSGKIINLLNVKLRHFQRRYDREQR